MFIQFIPPWIKYFAMKENLNLWINKTVVESAMRFAEQQGIDLSVAIEDFLARLVAESEQKDENTAVLPVSGDACQNMTDGAKWMVKEEQVSYQVTKPISQAELNAECITLEESKRRIMKKIHDHFHHS